MRKEVLFLIDTKALCALAVPLTRPLAWSGRTGVSFVVEGRR